MFEQKYFGIQLSLWLIIVGIIMILFSYNKSSVCAKLPPRTELKKEKFAEIPKTKIKVFNFNTSWCGWSRRFQPEWDKFSNKVKSEPKLSHIETFDVKCDVSNNESMCEKYRVPGYPYIVIETNGKTNQYNGERTADALIKEISTR
jgi:hypothetical protein